MVFTGVDVGVAVLVLISAILATARGFTREILSLATWAGSAAIAAYMYFYHQDIAAAYIKEPLVATGVTVIGSFIVALIILHLLTMWIGDLVVDSRVGPLDRTLGFVFGAARGVLICVVAAVFANFLLGPDEAKLPPMLKDAKSFPPLMSAGDYLIGLLPDNIESQVTDFLQKRGQNTDDTGPNDTTTPDDTGAAPDDGSDSTLPSLPPADVSSSAPAGA
jgi:membrane protein required for colicin V production